MTGEADIFNALLRHEAAGQLMMQHVKDCGQCGQLPEDPADLCPEGIRIMAEYEHYLTILMRADAPTFNALRRNLEH